MRCGAFYVIIIFMKREKKEPQGYTNKAYHIIVAGVICMILVAVVTALLFGYLMGTFSKKDEQDNTIYNSHYVFISDDDDEDFWNSIYDAACKEANEQNIYIENMAESLGVRFSNEDIFRIAINSSVDGIIYGGTANERISALIDEAVNKGIGVVVLQNDIENSARQSFVGVNNYELGQVYASQMARFMDLSEYMSPSVKVFINEQTSEGVANVISIAIEDYFQENYPNYGAPEVEFERVDSQDVFSVEEDIRTFFLDTKELPDIILCLNSAYTQCAYQAIVDYNRVGQTRIIGYFINDAILDAIDKQIIYSTISVDTEQMGRSSVLSLKEYEELGYTNSYVSVSTKVIGQDEARELIGEDNEE